MVRPVQCTGVVIPVNILRDQDAKSGSRAARVGFSNVLRIGISSLEDQTLREPLVQQELERVVLIRSCRQQAGNAGGIIGHKGQRLAGGATAELAVIQVHAILQFYGVSSDVTQ